MSSKAHTWHRKYFHTDYHVRRPPCIATIIIIYRCSEVLTWSHTINSHFLVLYMDGNGKYETNCDSFGFRSGFGFDGSLSTLTFWLAISVCLCPVLAKALPPLYLLSTSMFISTAAVCTRMRWGSGVYRRIFARHETFDGRKVIKLNANDYAECVDKRLYSYICATMAGQCRNIDAFFPFSFGFWRNGKLTQYQIGISNQKNNFIIGSSVAKCEIQMNIHIYLYFISHIISFLLFFSVSKPKWNKSNRLLARADKSEANWVRDNVRSVLMPLCVLLTSFKCSPNIYTKMTYIDKNECLEMANGKWCVNRCE